jgi:hypothetical protein
MFFWGKAELLNFNNNGKVCQILVSPLCVELNEIDQKLAKLFIPWAIQITKEQGLYSHHFIFFLT